MSKKRPEVRIRLETRCPKCGVVYFRTLYKSRDEDGLE